MIRKYFYLSMLLLSVIVLSTGCNNSSQSSSGTVSGIVRLDGQEVHAGITVSIFRADLASQQVLEIRQQYPDLAFPIDDKVLFDHRNYSPLQTVFTDQNGRFSFSKLPYDRYIVAYYMVGWGFNYIYDIELNMPELEVASNSLLLYPEIELEAYLDSELILEQGRNYVVKEDMVLGENSRLEFSSDSRLLIDKNVRISSYGQISSPGNNMRAYITSYSGCYTGSISEANLGDGFYIYSGATELNNMSFSHLRNALQVTVDGFSIENSSFIRCLYGFVSRSLTSLNVSNNFFYGNKNINAAACFVNSVQGYNANSNLFLDNYIAMKCELVTNAHISNSAFLDNDRGFVNLWESSSLFEYNTIRNNDVGIENSGYSNLTVSYNDIECRVGIKTYHTNNWYNTITEGWTKVNYNNIDCTQYAVESRALYYYNEGPYPLDFKNNWWGTTESLQIDNIIIDYHDLGLVGGAGVTSVVNYIPYRTSRVANAGIQI